MLGCYYIFLWLVTGAGPASGRGGGAPRTRPHHPSTCFAAAQAHRRLLFSPAHDADCGSSQPAHLQVSCIELPLPVVEVEHEHHLALGRQRALWGNSDRWLEDDEGRQTLDEAWNSKGLNNSSGRTTSRGIQLSQVHSREGPTRQNDRCLLTRIGAAMDPACTAGRSAQRSPTRAHLHLPRCRPVHVAPCGLLPPSRGASPHSSSYPAHLHSPGPIRCTHCNTRSSSTPV